MSESLPSIASLRALDGVVRSGSISAAAALLGVSVGAVSQHIRLLEQRLGVRLVEHHGRGILMTDKGRGYGEQVAAALEMLKDAQRNLRQTRSPQALCVSALPSPAASWVGASVHAFRRRYPGASIQLLGEEGEPDLAAGRVDFRISYGHRLLRHRRFVELFTDAVFPVCAPSLLRDAPLHHPAEILNYPLIAITWESEFTPLPGWIEWLGSLGVKAKAVSPVLSFSLSSMAVAAAVEGHGFALAQRSLTAAELSSGRLVAPFRHALPVTDAYFLAWGGGALEKPQGAALHQWLVAAGQETAGDRLPKL
jgi:LysR family transcriptional regulator, glycine cleavage system transcriptional activator